MAFDIKTFGGALSDGTGVLGAGAAGFGLPACALQLGELALALIPAPILLAIDKAMREWEEKIDQVIKDAFNWLATKFGIKQYLTDDGLISLKLDGIDDIDFWIPAAITKMLEAGAQIWQQIERYIDLYEGIVECLAAIRDALEGPENGSLADAAKNSFENDPEVNRYLAYAENANNLKKEIGDKRAQIGNELRLRRLDPNREPTLKPEFADLFAGTTFRVGSQTEEDEIIRLVFGPPMTTEGQLVLSIDGLYYDSQGEEGLVPVLNALANRAEKIDPADKWKFNYDPNLGGKGDQLSGRNFNKWIDSIFDLDLVDNGEMMQEHYNRDGFLQTLIGQRDKRVSDIDIQISSLVFPNKTEAIINNFKQTIISESRRYEDKINRRKKQIEVAVKAPSIFTGAEVFAPGKVPINDFSYLQKFNLSVALTSQENLVINTEDVSGIVLPIQPKFVKATSKADPQIIDHLYVPDEGFDAIVTDELDPQDQSNAATINLDEIVTTDGLVAIYNFLNSDVVLPSSIEYNLNNCASNDDMNDAQLVAKYSKDFFSSLGLAAPYFEGITVNSGNNPSALGSFAKLPDSPDFQDWTYNKEGFSFDAWVNAPGLNFGHRGWKDNDSSGLYRLILANENTGIGANTVRQENYNEVPFSDGSDYVRGMIVGFTIDQRWTKTSLPTNDYLTQDPSVSGYGFLIAPTISYDSSSVAFIAKEPCNPEQGWRGMFIPHTKTTANGTPLWWCENQFCQLAFTVDYAKDLLSVYLDGELLETSAVSEVFGTEPYKTVKIPSFKKDNSFEYGEATVGSLAPKSLKNGPKTYPFFTPWILGGGYTDGYAIGGNFMGGEYGGQRSGLKGHLGSVKFYNKTVEPAGIKNNFDTQKRLFKAVDASRSKSVFIFIGQSNMDGRYAPLDATVAEYQGPLAWSRIWTPNSLASTDGRWLTSDLVNYPERITAGAPGFGYGNLHASRYDIIEPIEATRFSLLNPSHFGMEVRLTELISQYEGGNEVYVIKNARGTTAMVSGLNVEQSVLSWTDNQSLVYDSQGSGLYTTLTKDVSAAMEKLQEDNPDTEYTIRGIFLIQGEFDAYPHAEQINYPVDENDSTTWSGIAGVWGHYFSSVLYQDLNEDLRPFVEKPYAQYAEVPWFVGRIQTEMQRTWVIGGPNANDLSATPVAVNVVRAQQEAVANDPNLNVYIVDQDNLTHVDNSQIHFTSLGLKTIGERFFTKYKEVLES